MLKKDKLKNSTEYILNCCKNPKEGLPEAVFLMVSALVPIANVDLFIFNNKKQMLLAWRNDIFFGEGWSIPGGCMRFGETLEERIHKTAYKELGQDVIIEKPIFARDVIRGENHSLKYPNIRGHNITIPYICKLENETQIDNAISKKSVFLQWFAKMPKNLLKVHHVYDDLFVKFGLMK